MPATAANPLNPKKLLLSKWTAAAPVNKEKHFVVIALVEAEAPGQAVTEVELQAVHSRRVQTIGWRALGDAGQWLQGWK